MLGELCDASSLLAQSYGGACAAAELSDDGDVAQANGAAQLTHLLRCSCLLSTPAPLVGGGQAQQASVNGDPEWLTCSRMRERVDDMLRACAR